jgi:magnesium-transporting ATPase (P-type)
MLTGDKVATAKCIAVMTGLKKRNSDYYEIVSPCDQLKIKHLLDNCETQLLNPFKKYVILVDGTSLNYILNDK